jgi:hypothetical protein
MSSRFMKFFRRPSALIPVVFLIHIGGAAAGDSAGDVQQKIRELLSGRPQAQSATPAAQTSDRTVRSSGDAHDSARRLLLGLTDASGQGARPIARPDNAAAQVGSVVPRNRHSYDDAQAMARSLILGRSNGASGGGLTRG